MIAFILALAVAAGSPFAVGPIALKQDSVAVQRVLGVGTTSSMCYGKVKPARDEDCNRVLRYSDPDGLEVFLTFTKFYEGRENLSDILIVNRRSRSMTIRHPRVPIRNWCWQGLSVMSRAPWNISGWVSKPFRTNVFENRRYPGLVAQFQADETTPFRLTLI